MTRLLWLGAVLVVPVVIAGGLRMVGARRWAESIRTHTRQLESGGLNVEDAAQRQPLWPGGATPVMK